MIDTDELNRALADLIAEHPELDEPFRHLFSLPSDQLTEFFRQWNDALLGAEKKLSC